MLTQQQLKNKFSYNPDTGLFYRKFSHKPYALGSPVLGCEKKRYINFCISGKTYAAHRLAFLYMNGKMPKDAVDHIDHNKKNNKWLNLREATKSQNQRNRTINKNNKSGYSGVVKRGSKWRVRITIDGKQKYFGPFLCRHEAGAIAKKIYRDNGYHINHGH
tara:strand:+ start:665 stop:1147 length:483 start_codon:yes stop_codon:yes gene_type:complete